MRVNCKILIKKPLANNQIKARRVRVIDVNGKQLGILDLSEALRISQERDLDLVQVTERVDPPVCKIMNYGKYLYLQEKKKKKEKKQGTLKGVRISYNISSHDLETKAKMIEKFLNKGDKVKIELRLKGRERTLEEHAKQKIQQFLEILRERIEFKIERELKKKSASFTIIISKKAKI